MGTKGKETMDSKAAGSKRTVPVLPTPVLLRKQENRPRASKSRTVRIVNRSTGDVLAREAVYAATFWSRLKGLLGKKKLREGLDGLVLVPCRGVHSFFMHTEIDILFVNGSGRIEHVVHALRPWSLSPVLPQARYVVELPAGTARRTGTLAGQQLSLCWQC